LGKIGDATYVVNVLLPSLDSFERRVAGEIEHDEGANSLLVVHPGEVAITLLTSNIPTWSLKISR
jgi:hypothetical protein